MKDSSGKRVKKTTIFTRILCTVLKHTINHCYFIAYFLNNLEMFSEKFALDFENRFGMIRRAFTPAGYRL